LENLTPLLFQPRPFFKKIPKKLERLWKIKPYGGVDGTWVRSEVVCKPIKGNTWSKLPLKQWFACEYHKVGLEGMLFGRVGFFWGLNAMVTITALRVCGFDSPQGMNSRNTLGCWFESQQNNHFLGLWWHFRTFGKTRCSLRFCRIKFTN